MAVQLIITGGSLDINEVPVLANMEERSLFDAKREANAAFTVRKTRRGHEVMADPGSPATLFAHAAPGSARRAGSRRVVLQLAAQGRLKAWATGGRAERCV